MGTQVCENPQPCASSPPVPWLVMEVSLSPSGDHGTGMGSSPCSACPLCVSTPWFAVVLNAVIAGICQHDGNFWSALF